MNTISDILMDIDRGCLANNMIENCLHTELYILSMRETTERNIILTAHTKIYGNHWKVLSEGI